MDIFWLNALLLLASPFIGSFIALVAYRLPRKEPILVGRSRCDHCKKSLSSRELVPLFAFFWLQGRCRHCGGKIAPHYLLLELAALAIALWALFTVPSAQAWITVGLGWTLLLLAAVDATSFRLPDFATLPLVPAGLLATLYFHPPAFYQHLIAAAGGFAFIHLVAFLYKKVRRRHGIGAGDAKLFAACGAWVGLYGLPSALLIAALSALTFAVGRSLISSREDHRLSQTMKLPFGAFLTLGFWLVWLYGPLELVG